MWLLPVVIDLPFVCLTVPGCTLVNAEIPWLSGIVPDSFIPYPDYTNRAVSMVLDSSWLCLTVPNCSLTTRSSVLNCSRLWLIVPSCTKLLPTVPEWTMSFLTVPNCTRQCLVVPDRFSLFPNVPNCSRLQHAVPDHVFLFPTMSNVLDRPLLFPAISNVPDCPFYPLPGWATHLFMPLSHLPNWFLTVPNSAFSCAKLCLIVPDCSSPYMTLHDRSWLSLIVFNRA